MERTIILVAKVLTKVSVACKNQHIHFFGPHIKGPGKYGKEGQEGGTPVKLTFLRRIERFHSR